MSPADSEPAASGSEATPDSFETALEELESIVSRLERGELTLDESVAAFERGTGLLRFLSSKLEAAEKRVKVLLESEGGGLLEGFLEEDGS